MVNRGDFELLWPFKGLQLLVSSDRQPKDTTCDALNVRTHDPKTDVARGAQRPGLTKASSARQSNNQVQFLGHTVERNTPSGATTLSPRTITNCIITNGVVGKWASGSIANASGNTLSSTVPVIFGTELFGKLYFCDGAAYEIWDPTTNAVATWTPTDGSLPEGSTSSHKGRLIVTWRSRIVVSGVESDAHNWFMSEVGDPLNWDYAPTTGTTTQAVAGNNAEAGKDADIINCMIPYSDDVLIFGGDHTIQQMTGDPAAGGQIDRITDTIGMAWGEPWCKDPEGNIYFFGSRGGIYTMRPGSMPRSVTMGSVESELMDFDMNKTLVRLAWSEREKGVYVFFTNLDGTVGNNYFYDVRNQAWWRDKFANASHLPTAVDVFDGDDPDDRVILLGGRDGYIRIIDVDAEGDDGTAIDSYCWMGPMYLKMYPWIRVHQTIVHMASSTDEATLSAYAGETPAAAKAATACWSETLSAGKNKPIRDRAHGQAVMFHLQNNTLDESWSLESILVAYHSFPARTKRLWI